MTLEPVLVPDHAHVLGGGMYHASREVASLPGESREESNCAACDTQRNARGDASTAAGHQALQKSGTCSDGRQTQGCARLLRQDCAQRLDVQIRVQTGAHYG